MAFRRSSEKNEVKVLDEEASHYEGVPQVHEIGSFRVLGLTSEDADFYTNYPQEKRKEVFRKVRFSNSSQTVGQQLTLRKGRLPTRSHVGSVVLDLPYRPSKHRQCKN